MKPTNIKTKPRKLIKLQGILKDQDIDFSDLKTFRKETWEHLEKEIK
ncbi:Uncharacterized protein dnl_49830 [Desulfonema limicola]|uniref:Uncharacterized protein n=1 Tax=Desulfonema limicola TaxID=45656 RepID=A0A975GIH4_9BACT|nr:hypothetical protein [Desulfonema limicola]QTA82605.1 Uncharacterized protein dnl_49830 [Desulfonema limicola]